MHALRSKLSLCEADKAALQTDVEMLCLQTTSLSSSSVLKERVMFTGAQGAGVSGRESEHRIGAPCGDMNAASALPAWVELASFHLIFSRS